MNTIKLKKLHERQCSLFEMIEKCDKRAKELQDDLLKPCYYLTIPNEIKSQIKRLKAIKLRLISYYKDIQIRIMTLQPEIELPEREGNLLTNQFLS